MIKGRLQMKILYTNFHQNYGGGHDTYILNLVQGFADKHDITVAVPATSCLFTKLQSISSINLLAFRFKFKLQEFVALIKEILRLRKTIIKYEYDIIHTNGSSDHKLVLLAALFLKKKPKIIYTKHNNFKMKWSAEFRACYSTDKIIVVSQHTLSLYSPLVLKHTPVVVIPNGVDTDYYQPVSKEVATALKAKFNFLPDDIILASVAGTAPYKGWHFLVEAVAKLPQLSKKNIKIVIAGETPNPATIDRYVRSLDMQQQVIFTGLLTDVRDVIAIADIGFVLSYNVETISFACREMMAMGKPVLVSDYSGLPENINDKYDGWIVRTGDIEEIKNCLARILANLPESHAMGANAREKAVNDFSLTKFLSATQQAYYDVSL
jgi:glycosyltransferase involved in cell wall biosynthesis